MAATAGRATVIAPKPCAAASAPSRHVGEPTHAPTLAVAAMAAVAVTSARMLHLPAAGPSPANGRAARGLAAPARISVPRVRPSAARMKRVAPAGAGSATSANKCVPRLQLPPAAANSRVVAWDAARPITATAVISAPSAPTPAAACPEPAQPTAAGSPTATARPPSAYTIRRSPTMRIAAVGRQIARAMAAKPATAPASPTPSVIIASPSSPAAGRTNASGGAARALVATKVASVARYVRTALRLAGN